MFDILCDFLKFGYPELTMIIFVTQDFWRYKICLIQSWPGFNQTLFSARARVFILESFLICNTLFILCLILASPYHWKRNWIIYVSGQESLWLNGQMFSQSWSNLVKLHIFLQTSRFDLFWLNLAIFNYIRFSVNSNLSLYSWVFCEHIFMF